MIKWKFSYDISSKSIKYILNSKYLYNKKIFNYQDRGFKDFSKFTYNKSLNINEKILKRLI